jgi:hypothetical protein
LFAIAVGVLFSGLAGSLILLRNQLHK